MLKLVVVVVVKCNSDFNFGCKGGCNRDFNGGCKGGCNSHFNGGC